MEESGPELHPTAPPPPTTEISLKDDESDGNDSSKYEEEPSDLNPPISGKTLKNEESQGIDCPRYEDVIHDEKLEPPPPYMPPLSSADPVDIAIPTSIISEDVARQALLEYAKKKFCYSTGPAQQMLLRDFQPLNTFRYLLDTFTETRTCEWVTDPYHGEEVDGPGNGPAPEPWTLRAEPPNLFQKADYCVPVPHTSSVEICVCCGGQGRLLCHGCTGKGKRLCFPCCGTGCFQGQICCMCFGSGETICFSCRGSGRIICIACCGKGKHLQFLQMKIKWKKHDFAFLSENRSDVPTERFYKMSGKIIFNEEKEKVSPITNFPTESINESSKMAIIQHRPDSTDTKIVRQRHTIEWLPLTRVNYNWNDEVYNYYVYGNENRVYVKDYPKKEVCTVM